MKQVEIGRLDGHPFGIGEPGEFVLRGKSRDPARRLHRLPYRRGSEVRAAGRPLAVPEVDGDSETVVSRVLDGLDLAESDVDVEAGGSAERGLGRARAAFAGDVVGELHDVAQRVEIVLAGKARRRDWIRS